MCCVETRHCGTIYIRWNFMRLFCNGKDALKILVGGRQSFKKINKKRDRVFVQGRIHATIDARFDRR